MIATTQSESYKYQECEDEVKENVYLPNIPHLPTVPCHGYRNSLSIRHVPTLKPRNMKRVYPKNYSIKKKNSSKSSGGVVFVTEQRETNAIMENDDAFFTPRICLIPSDQQLGLLPMMPNFDALIEAEGRRFPLKPKVTSKIPFAFCEQNNHTAPPTDISVSFSHVALSPRTPVKNS